MSICVLNEFAIFIIWAALREYPQTKTDYAGIKMPCGIMACVMIINKGKNLQPCNKNYDR